HRASSQLPLPGPQKKALLQGSRFYPKTRQTVPGRQYSLHRHGHLLRRPRLTARPYSRSQASAGRE
ncbi:MAG: hypothetical protein QHH02_07040, partial [Syntrophomonadaceae bacterium]|nr:hypothetical protein [Syntrophomonadaceae bacterium]